MHSTILWDRPDKIVKLQRPEVANRGRKAFRMSRLSSGVMASRCRMMARSVLWRTLPTLNSSRSSSRGVSHRSFVRSTPMDWRLPSRISAARSMYLRRLPSTFLSPEKVRAWERQLNQQAVRSTYQQLVESQLSMKASPKLQSSSGSTMGREPQSMLTIRIRWPTSTHISNLLRLSKEATSSWQASHQSHSTTPAAQSKKPASSKILSPKS